MTDETTKKEATPKKTPVKKEAPKKSRRSREDVLAAIAEVDRMVKEQGIPPTVACDRLKPKLNYQSYSRTKKNQGSPIASKGGDSLDAISNATKKTREGVAELNRLGIKATIVIK